MDLASLAAKTGSVRRSLLRFAPALVLLAIVLADAMRAASTDLWGHIRFGQLIASEGHLIPHALFAYSFPPPGPQWIDHEWLAQVIIALCYDAGGVVGLKLMKLTCTTIMIILLARANAETGASLTLQFSVLIVTAFTLLPQMQLRPQLFTFVLLAALVLILARSTYGRRTTPWVVIALFVPWANLHGGFIVGIVVLATYAVTTGVVDVWRQAKWSRACRLALITIVSALATLINPYGAGVWRVLIGTFRTPLTMHRIAEYQPLLSLFRSAYSSGAPIFPLVCFLGILGALLISVVIAPCADDLSLVAVALILSAASFYAVRNMALAVIVAAVPLTRHAGLALARSFSGVRASPEDASTPLGRPMCLALQGAVAALALSLAVRTGLFSATLPAIADEPVGAVEFMAAHGVNGNVLCAYRWGVYVIWHQAPLSRVFIDSFEIMYPRRVQADFLTFNDAEPGAGRVLDAYPNDFVLMPTGSAAYSVMMAQAGWRLLYRDPISALFARAGSPATRLAGVPDLARTAPPSVFP